MYMVDSSTTAHLFSVVSFCAKTEFAANDNAATMIISLFMLISLKVYLAMNPFPEALPQAGVGVPRCG